jgi:hypothetical protein
MKINFFRILLVLLLALILLIASTTCDPVPFSFKNGKGLDGYNYEGYRNIEYTTYPQHNSIDSKTQNSIDTAGSDPFVKVGTYYGLLSSHSAPSPKLDMFLDTPPKPNCVSSGLVNSAGPLCLTDEQYKLLSTRGGNIA